ncbi:MAG: DPP IV N-terminal domain-containing protein, partial [Chthonomonadales bacterium]
MKIRHLLASIVVAAIAFGGSAGHAQYPLRQYLSIRAALGPTISPDGKQVAFRSSITGTSQLWKVGEKDKWPEQLTFFSSPINNAFWSPDGSSILVIVDKDGNEQFQFYLVKPDGLSVKPLTENPKVRYNWGGWSSNGKQIFFSSNLRNPEFFDCYVMDIDTKSEKRVFTGDGSYYPGALSHDGKTMAVVKSMSNTDSDLIIVDVETGSTRTVSKPKAEVNYSPVGFTSDDKSLILRTDEGREFVNLASMNLASLKATFIGDEPHDIDIATMSNNGRYLAYKLGQEAFDDIYALPLFG